MPAGDGADRGRERGVAGREVRQQRQRPDPHRVVRGERRQHVGADRRRPSTDTATECVACRWTTAVSPGPLAVHREVQQRFLGRRIAGHVPPSASSTARRAGSSAPSDDPVGVIRKPSSVRSERLPVLPCVSPRSNSDSASAQSASRSSAALTRSIARRLGEEVVAAEVARLERERRRLAADRARPRHAGIDLGPDRQRAHAERLDDGAGGLAAGHDERPHAAAASAARNAAERFLDEARGARGAERAPARPRPRPAPRSRRRAPAVARSAATALAAIAPPSRGSAASAIGSSCERGRRARSGRAPARAWPPSSCRTATRRARRRRRPRPRAGATLPRVRGKRCGETQRQSGTAGREREVDAGSAGGHQVLVARRVDDRVAAALGREPREPRAHRVGARVDVGARDRAPPCPCVCAASTRTRFASVIGVSGWSRMPRVRQQHVADEQVAEVDGALVARDRRAWPVREARAERLPAAPRSPARCCPASVESNVEQYLK